MWSFVFSLLFFHQLGRRELEIGPTKENKEKKTKDEEHQRSVTGAHLSLSPFGRACAREKDT